MNHSLPYDDMHPQYPDSFTADSAASESRYPSQMHPHPLFTRQGNAPYNNNNNNNPPSPFTSWHNPSYPQTYNYPSHSPFPAPRLSPPPTHHTPVNFKSPQSQNQRLTLAGSLDPSTGIFYRTPEHPRLRTAQACEKCRTRKAKCSGEHPTCKRCLTRGLICEYAKEGRVRGPNKAKSKANSVNDTSSNKANIANDTSSNQANSVHDTSSNKANSANDTSSNTPVNNRNRLLHAMSHTPTDQLMNLGMPYSVSPLQSPSMSEEFMYPSPVYLEQHHPFPQYSMRNASSNPISSTTCGSSPHTSGSGSTSAINSPLTPAPAPPFLMSPSASRVGIKMDIDMTNVDPAFHGPRSGGLGGTIPLEPVWIDHLGNAYPQLNSSAEILGTDERGQHGLSTQMGVMEGSIFVKNGQSQVDAQQDFHGQSHDQSHNYMQHYPALDLRMC